MWLISAVEMSRFSQKFLFCFTVKNHPPETLIGSFSLQMFLLWSKDGRVANTCWGGSSDGPMSGRSLSTSTFKILGFFSIPLFPDRLSHSI